MNLIEKYLGEAKTKLSKEVIAILKKVKDWDYDMTYQGVDFFYVKDKRIPEGGKWAKIQMPYFDMLQNDGQRIDAYVGYYHGEELLNTETWKIGDLKTFENVLKQVKKRTK